MSNLFDRKILRNNASSFHSFIGENFTFFIRTSGMNYYFDNEKTLISYKTLFMLLVKLYYSLILSGRLKDSLFIPKVILQSFLYKNIVRNFLTKYLKVREYHGLLTSLLTVFKSLE